MAKALKCDRCGQFYDLLTASRNYRIILSTEEYKHEKYVDLCPDCYEKLCDFLDGAWKSIGMKPKEKEIEERHFPLEHLTGTGELYPGEFESRHYEFEEGSDGSSGT